MRTKIISNKYLINLLDVLKHKMLHKTNVCSALFYGLTTIEYLLLGSLIAVVCTLTIGSVGANASESLGTVNNAIEGKTPGPLTPAKKNIEEAIITIADPYTETDNIVPSIIVSYEELSLVENIDFVQSSSINEGVVTFIIKGSGEYQGTMNKSFLWTDPTYKTIHHDAVTHVSWVDTSHYEARQRVKSYTCSYDGWCSLHQWQITGSGSGATSAAATSAARASASSRFADCLSHGAGYALGTPIAQYESYQAWVSSGYNQTITDKSAWDEQVIDEKGYWGKLA